MLMLLGLLACHPAVTLTYLQPANLSLPPEMQTVSVVDRVGSDLSKLAVGNFSTTLLDSPRLKAVDPALGQSAYSKATGELVGKPLQLTTVQAIVAASAGGGVATLESFAIKGEWVYSVHEEQVTETSTVKDCSTCEAREVEVTHGVNVYEAVYNAVLESHWALYDKNGNQLDQVTLYSEDSLYGEGSEQGTAMAAAGSTSALEQALALDAGRAYAARIAPLPAWAERFYYKMGALSEGHKALKNGDWEGAEKAWEEAAKSDNDHVKGKALYDLAIIAEYKGHLNKAHKLVLRAQKLLGDKRLVRNYLAALEQRQAEEKALNDQLQSTGSTLR